MKASPIIVNWHSDTAPIYSADFQPNGKGRLATAGGDNNVRLWRLDVEGEDSRVEYLCTMTKHTQAVNAVRWAPKSLDYLILIRKELIVFQATYLPLLATMGM